MNVNLIDEIPVTRTKISVPRRPAHLLTRQRLLDLLYDLLDFRLIIIAAPAGYGKTSLLLDLAHHVELPICWYALDELDQDPQRFIAHLIASLAQRFPDFGNESAAALQNMGFDGLDLDRMVTVIVNDAYEHIREHFVLVLDDFHLVSSSERIDRFVNHLIQRADENCHLILSSRTLLTLPDLPLMVARSQVGGLGFEELAFRAEEFQAMVLQNYRLTMPESVAEELAQETEGWITGLLLSAQTMWQGMVDRVRTARIAGVGLYEYLAQQVLEQQPAQIRDFLLRTSLLEEFDAELCEAVLGPGEDWPGLIEAVLQRNLFILPVNDAGTWLRYHHLFRDFLQAWLERERPGEKDRILRRQAKVYREREDWAKAHRIYWRIGDVVATAKLIEQAGSSMIKGGRLLTLAEWLDALPSETLQSHPSLLSLRGDVAVMMGEVQRGLSLLHSAEAAFRETGEIPHLARTLVRRATAHRFRADYQASLTDAEEALALTEGRKSLDAVRASALRSKGLSLYWMGQLHEAVEWLERSLTAHRALNDEQNVALLLTELGLAYSSGGHYDDALDHYKRALTYWQQVHNDVRQATLLNNLGVLHHQKGDYERAASLLEEALECARQGGYARMEALTLTSIGDLYADLEAPEAAQDAYRQAREIANSTKDLFLLLYLELSESAIALSEKDLPRARRYLEAAERLARDSSSRYERGLWQLGAGRLALAEGAVPEAIVCMEKAALSFNSGGQRVECARSHLYLSVAFRALGEGQKAKSHLARAFRLATDLESEHILVVVGREARPLLDSVQRDPALGRQASDLLQQICRFEHSIPSLRRRLRHRTLEVPIGPPRLTIHALGTTWVELDGDLVMDPEWQSRQVVRELFFLFLAHPDGSSKEAVGVILWPDSSPSQLKLRFKNAIYRLRRALGKEVISFEEGVYRFNQALDYEYDVEAFLGKIAQARAATGATDRVAAYRDAVRLYAGPYLPEAERPWVWPIREKLHQAYLEAVLELAKHFLEAAEYETALSHCERALSEDVCLEEAHRLAMRAHAAMGSRVAVARQYERCRRALREEIDAPPSAQTETLFEKLMR